MGFFFKVEKVDYRYAFGKILSKMRRKQLRKEIRNMRPPHKKKVISLRFCKRPQLSLSQMITIAKYRRQIKDLQKNNIALAITLQEKCCDVSSQNIFLKNYTKDTSSINYAKVKLKNVAFEIQKIVSDLNEVVELLNITGFEAAWNQDHKLLVKEPDCSSIPEMEDSEYPLEEETGTPLQPQDSTPQLEVSSTEMHHLSPTDKLSDVFTNETECKELDDDTPTLFTNISTNSPTPEFIIPPPPKKRRRSPNDIPQDMNIPSYPSRSNNSGFSKIPVHDFRLKSLKGLLDILSKKPEKLSSSNEENSTALSPKVTEELLEEKPAVVLPLKVDSRRATYTIPLSQELTEWISHVPENETKEDVNTCANPCPLPDVSENKDSFVEKTILLLKDMEFTEVIPTSTIFLTDQTKKFFSEIPDVNDSKEINIATVGKTLGSNPVCILEETAGSSSHTEKKGPVKGKKISRISKRDSKTRTTKHSDDFIADIEQALDIDRGVQSTSSSKRKKELRSNSGILKDSSDLTSCESSSNEIQNTPSSQRRSGRSRVAKSYKEPTLRTKLRR